MQKIIFKCPQCGFEHIRTKTAGMEGAGETNFAFCSETCKEKWHAEQFTQELRALQCAPI